MTVNESSGPSAAGGRSSEYLTLLVGLLFCAVVLTLCGLLQATLGRFSPAPDAFRADFATLAAVGDILTFPPALALAFLSVGAVLRQWNFRARRTQWRLSTFVLLIVATLVEAAVIGPAGERIVTAITGSAPVSPADVDHLTRWNWLRAACALAIGLSVVAAHRAPMPVAVAVSRSGLTPRHRTLLLLVGTATLFEGYDRFIASLALPYIGKDLGAGEGVLGFVLAFIRVGALISILFGRAADRYGRRRLLIISVTAYTLATAATAFSTGVVDFALFQLVAVVFLAVELTLAQVVIAEEFPPAARGMGQGLLGAFAALGSGLAAMLFPLLQRSEFGWRGMYLIGLLPLLAIAYLRRNLPETQRWSSVHPDRANAPRIRDVFHADLRTRLLVLTVLSLAASATAGPAFSFASYRATTTFNWSPAQVSTMIVGAGTVGFIGYFVMGRLADAFGRRTIGCLGLLFGSCAVATFYLTEWLFAGFALLTFSESGALIALNSLATELFPTRLRATAKAWVNNSSTVGALLGLAAVGALSGASGGHGVVIAALAAVTFLLAPLMFLLPETRRIDLEEVDAAALGSGTTLTDIVPREARVAPA